MVEAYLDKNVLIFDRAQVKSMFAEADYRKEGSLDAKCLKAALDGAAQASKHVHLKPRARSRAERDRGWQPCCCRVASVLCACCVRAVCVLAARYPKRQLYREWRELAALLLGIPELVLADDIKQPKTREVWHIHTHARAHTGHLGSSLGSRKTSRRRSTKPPVRPRDCGACGPSQGSAILLHEDRNSK